MKQLSRIACATAHRRPILTLENSKRKLNLSE
jgi:hypothetical protein